MKIFIRKKNKIGFEHIVFIKMYIDSGEEFSRLVVSDEFSHFNRKIHGRTLVIGSWCRWHVELVLNYLGMSSLRQHFKNIHCRARLVHHIKFHREDLRPKLK